MMRAPRPLAQVRQNRLRDEEDAGEIDAERMRPHGQIGLLERRARRLAGIVDENVDGPEFSRARDRPAAIASGCVTSKPSSTRPAPVGSGERLAAAPPGGRRATRARRVRKGARDRRADAGACARHQDMAAGEILESAHANLLANLFADLFSARGALQSRFILRLAGQILLRPADVRQPDLRGFVQQPGRIGEVRPRHGAKVGASGADDRIRLVEIGDGADRNRRDPDLVADLVGERRLEHAAIDGLLVLRHLAGRTIDEIGAAS